MRSVEPSRGREINGLEEMWASRWSAAIRIRRSASQKTVSEGLWPGRCRAFSVRSRKAISSPSDTIFFDPATGDLLGGDHLIKHISSNPLISRPLGGRSGEPGDGRPRALLMYMASLRETREMPIERVLPGHGDEFGGHAALIDERFEMHERRAGKIAGLIAERPRTAHEIAQAIWGNVAVTQAYLTLSEVLGHVDLLVERGEVVEADRGGIVELHPA